MTLRYDGWDDDASKREKSKIELVHCFHLTIDPVDDPASSESDNSEENISDRATRWLDNSLTFGHLQQ